MSRRSRKTTHAWRRLTPCSRRHTGSRQRARKSNHAALRSAHRSALRQGQWSDGHDPQRRRDLHHPVLHLQLQRLGEWKDSAMSETKPMSARATPRPWAAQEPGEDGIAIIGLRTNNGLPYDSPTNGIVALVVMWPT